MPRPGKTASATARPEGAQGVVRDAIAALHNFETLLRSPKVGPHALEEVVPDLRSMCSPVRHALGSSVARLAVRTGMSAAAAALRAHVPSLCDSLEAALERADDHHLNARSRLGLEDAVRAGAEGLGAALGLVEMLEAAANAPRVELDVSGAVYEAFASSHPTGPPTITMVGVWANLPAEGCAIAASARVLTRLVVVAVGIVHDRDPTRRLSLGVTCARGGPVRMTVSRDEVVGDALLVRPAAVLPPTVPCAEAAAAASGATFRILDGGDRVEIDWPVVAS